MPSILQSGIRLVKITQLQTYATILEKGRMIQKAEWRFRRQNGDSEGRVDSHEGLFPGFET